MTKIVVVLSENAFPPSAKNQEMHAYSQLDYFIHSELLDCLSSLALFSFKGFFLMYC
jgi:hypothetical protein